jgi:hypothetical protein
VSARDELISLLRTTMDEKDAVAVADAYAHELAEKIRPMGTTWEGMSAYAAAAAGAFRAAADLIDPEAET